MFQIGQIFGDFEILECLGQGEAGTMYRARQVSADRIVALKVMHGVPAPAPEAVARFCHDAQVAMALRHPDLVQALATGETDGVHWVALEFVEGTNAQARLKRKGRLALPEVIAIATHVAGALDYGWRKAKLIHGDVEPDTILLSKKSEVKLAGLGFGHGLGDVKPFAADGAPSGAAHYVSPERAEGKKDADFRADIYSLGCTLFHLISGETPYPGDTALAVILHHCTMPVPQLQTVRPECPPEISRMVMKMMHKMPSGRHQDYEELIADLRLCYEVLTAPPKAEAVPAPAAPAPAQAAAAVPPRESIGVPVAAPTARPAPSRESINAAMQQRTAAAKPDVTQGEPIKVAVMLPEEKGGEETEQPGEKRRRFGKPLIIGAGVLAGAIIALICIAPWKGERLSEAQRAERDRASGKLTPIPKISPTPKPAVAKTTPVARKIFPVRTPPPLDRQFAGPAQRGITPEHVTLPPKREEAPPEPTALTMPAVPAVPVAPVAPAVPAAPQSVTAKWIAEQEPKWQAAYAGEVSAPFEKAVAELNVQYRASVERELATLPASEAAASAVAFRAERTRITAGGTVPAEDESMAPPSLRTIRAGYRTAFAKLDAERFAKAKSVHARHDAILAQTQAALTQKLRTSEAQEIQAKRDSLRDAWLKPPAGSAPAAADATPTPEPVPPKPAPAPATRLPKLAPRQLVERLLAMGATFSVGSTGAPKPIAKIADLPGDKFAIVKIEFIPLGEISTADLDIIEQLPDVEELLLTGVPATDATIKLLRSLPSLRVLGLRDLKDVSAVGFRSVATLPSLKTLTVRGPIGAESLGAFVASRKLESLTLSDVTFAEPDFGAIASIPALKTLTIVTRDPVKPAAWARLAAAKKLTTLNLEKTPKTAEMIAHIGRIAPLTSLSLGDVALADADLAPLGALKHLQTLKTTADSTLDGSIFASWPLNPVMKTLTFASTKSVSDKALRGIATAFPNLERLEVRANSGSVTPVGLTHLQKLRKLNYLNFTGDAMDATALGHLVIFDQLTHLGLGAARLTEADVRVLAKFGSLRELEWLSPPVTDGALKGFAKLRTLTQFKIGNTAKPEVTEKLVAALPTVKVVP